MLMADREPAAAKKPDRLINDCAQVRRYFACQQTVNGKPDAKGVRHRTINDFRGRDLIHFEAARSTDGRHWTVTLAGNEKRKRCCGIVLLDKSIQQRAFGLVPAMTGPIDKWRSGTR
jgi:hypothetical protein